MKLMYNKIKYQNFTVDLIGFAQLIDEIFKYTEHLLYVAAV